MTYSDQQLPNPTPNQSPSIHDLVIKRIEGDRLLSSLTPELQARKQVGLDTYGVPLQVNNGRPVGVDEFQELVDAVVYLEKSYQETGDPEWLDIQYVVLRAAAWLQRKLNGRLE